MDRLKFHEDRYSVLKYLVHTPKNKFHSTPNVQAALHSTETIQSGFSTTALLLQG